MSKMPTIIVDLRPIQSGKINGVTISSTNWIQDLIEQTQNKAKILLWTNGLKSPHFPQNWLNHKHLSHKHTKIPNKILNPILARTKLIKIDKLLNTKASKYFCPDLRPFHLSSKIKSYIYIHDIAFIKYKHFYSLKSKIWYWLIQPKKIYQKASRVLTNSKFSKNEIIKELGAHKVKVIHPYLSKNWSRFKKTKNKINKPYFITIATLQPRKNLNNLIQAFELFNINKKYKLVIVGVGDKAFKKTENLSKSDIKFVGQATENQKKNLIHNSKGLVHIPIYEGFSLPILEALQLNKPVLASNIPPHKEIYIKQIIYCMSTNLHDISANLAKLTNQKKVQSLQQTDRTNLTKVLLE